MQGLTRDALHAIWNQASHDLTAGHFDLGQNGFDGNPLQGVPFLPGGTAQSMGNRADYWRSGVVGGGNLELVPEFPIGGVPLHNPTDFVRLAELDLLQEAGAALGGVAMLDPVMVGQANPNSALEPRWRFDGMADSGLIDLGPAYSVFKYILSDLFVGGITSAMDLMLTMKDIFCDIKVITGGVITDDDLFMLYFEGGGVDGFGGTPHLTYGKRGFTFGEAMQDDFEDIFIDLAETLSIIQDSDPLFMMWFFRVYVGVLTNLPAGGGGGLRKMPMYLQELRNGKFYKGKKGYLCIDEDEDANCGLMALLMGLANIANRIKKTAKLLSKVPPEICDDLKNFRVKLEKKSKKAEQVKLSLLYEMASSIGWKKGTNIRPSELCDVMKFINQKYKLNVGLIIFDAVYPLRNIIISYDTNGKLPKEKLCLVHWEYKDVNGQMDGHYDTVYATNLVSWIQRGVENRNRLVFCFRTLKLVRNNETTEKGDLCQNCGSWQLNVSSRIWKQEHGGYSRLFPCFKVCSECKVEFRGEDCYLKHLNPIHGLGKSSCETRRFCSKCRKIHATTYACEFFFCQLCKKKDLKELKEKHICYLGQSSSKKMKCIEHVVYSDCEGSRLSGHHEAVCIASAYKNMCEDHKRELKERKCEGCVFGDSEFGPFCTDCLRATNYDECPDCQAMNTNIFVGEDCIIKYLEWLETTFKKCLVVFHNGGRYDFHLLYLQLFKSGKYYIKKEAERGTQIIFMSVGLLSEERREKKIEIRFIDSFNFIHSSLRSFPDMFGIDKELLSKGRFPYELLNKQGWENYKGECPDYKLFGITETEWKNIDKLNKARAREVKEIKEYIQEEKGKEWVAMDKLIEYTKQDVRVLYAGCEKFRKCYWEAIQTDPFHWVTLPSAVAGTYRLSDYMPKESIQVFPLADREWQRAGLRGGRCEPFKLYWKAQHEDQELKMVDVNSEYPAAQMYGYAPYGPVSWDRCYDEPVTLMKAAKEFKKKFNKNLAEILHDSTGYSGNGIIECLVETAICDFPILPYKVKTKQYTKNLFMIRTGAWQGWISVLAEAILHRQVIITGIKRIQFWNTTSDQLFRKFLAPVYAGKVEASGWKKIFGKAEVGDEEKKAFVNGSAERGIMIDEEKVADNPGVRSTNKLIANCGWGYMCQKPHATEFLYFNNSSQEEVKSMRNTLVRLDSHEDCRRLVGIPRGVGKFTRLKVTKEIEKIDIKELNANIAYHVGGCAPAWGLQLLSRKINKLHPDQPVYCDTDSILYVWDKKKIERGQYKEIKTGLYLGDFVDEYPGYRIDEFVSIGPKSYFYHMTDRKTGATQVIGKFKGLPYMSSSYSLLDEKAELAVLGMEQMKNILFSAQGKTSSDILEEKLEEKIDGITMKFQYTNFFKRSPDLKIRENKESKTLRFTFDKRRVIWPMKDPKECYEVSTVPFIQEGTDLTQEEVAVWWEERIRELNLYII